MTNDISKKSLKHVQIALNNFNEAVSQQVNLLKEHKTSLVQVKDNPSKVRNQEIIIKRTEKQLKNLLYELDTLRAQVQDDELDKFDIMTVSLRKIILQIITEYKDMSKQLKVIQLDNQAKNSEVNQSTTGEPAQLQISADLEEIKIKERESCLQNVEKIQTDIQDLHSMYGDLSQMVNDQGEMVDKVVTNVEDTQENINIGVKHLAVASRLKASMYPVAGAVMGGVIAGPIGLVAGLKAGGLAALSLGCIGYVGGRVLNKTSCMSVQEHTSAENPLHNRSEQLTSTDTENKKDE